VASVIVCYCATSVSVVRDEVRSMVSMTPVVDCSTLWVALPYSLSSISLAALSV
jgi:hypothetical protein